MIAIISDIHSNLEALQAALDYIDNHKIESIYCLGDIVGYGPNPNECIELIRKRCQVVLMGNHDYAAVGLANIEYFNEYAKMSTYWTIERLREENRSYLSNLPFSHQTNNSFFVHASPSNPSFWYYVLSVQDAQMEMQSFDQRICFIGHSHVPVVFTQENLYREVSFTFEPNEKYIVNVGSIGQPRDGNSNLCFAVMDEQKNSVEFVRLSYDLQKTYSKIIKAGLPLFLAERILKGY